MFMANPLYEGMKKNWTPDVQKKKDIELITKWYNEMQEEKDRGYSFGGKVGSILSEMPSTMVEFAMTSGLSAAGKKLTTKMLGEWAEKNAKRKIFAKVLGTAVGSGARTVGGFQHRVAEKFIEGELPESVSIEDGKISIKLPKKNPFTSYAKALGDTFIEALSEESGDAFKWIGRAGADKLATMPVTGGIIRAMHKKLGGKIPLSKWVKKISTKTGFHGAVEEVGEEFLGDQLRAIFAIDDFDAGDGADIFERMGAGFQRDFDNLPAMFLAFSIPGAGRRGLSVIGNKLDALEKYEFDPHEVVTKEHAEAKLAANSKKRQAQYIEAFASEKPRMAEELEERQPYSVFVTEEGYEADPRLMEIEGADTVEDPIQKELQETVDYLVDQGMDPEKALVRALSMVEGADEVKDKVTFAKSPGAPSSKRLVRITPDNTKKMERTTPEAAIELSQETGMPLAEAEEIIRGIRGESVEQQKMEYPASAMLKAQIGKRNAAKLRKYAGSREVFDELASLVEKRGGVPNNPDFQKPFFDALKLEAAKRRTQRAKQQKNTVKLAGIKASIMSKVQPLRYALAELEVSAGAPLRYMWDSMVFKSNTVKRNIADEMERLYVDIGLSPKNVNIGYEENENIINFLFAGDMDAFRQLNQEKQKIAMQYKDLLNTLGRDLVTKLRWKLWNKFGVKPDGVSDADARLILAEGQQAEAEGRLDEWIVQQEWGAREIYYMSENPEDSIDYMIDLMTPKGMKERGVGDIGKTPREARARRGDALPKQGSVPKNIHQHLTRLALANELLEDVDGFWNSFVNADVSKDDASSMRTAIERVLGINKPVGTIGRITQKARSYFWRAHFLNPAKGAYFFIRNCLQNIAYLPSQLGVAELAKASYTLMRDITGKKKNERRIAAFTRNYVDNVSQKRKLYTEAMIMEEEEASNILKSHRVRQMVRATADGFASWSLSSDSINRTTAWNLLWTSADTRVNQLKDGKINYKKLASKLKLHLLHNSQQQELIQLLDAEKYDTFVEQYANYKTENVHFRYETSLRSAIEQDPTSRALAGLLVYPRGVINLAYKNGLVPLADGVRIGDFDKAYQGLMSLLTLAAGTALARWMLYKLTGRKSYGIPSYSPISPGVSQVAGWMDDINQITAKGLGLEASAKGVLKVSGDMIEFLIPLSDMYIDLYESQHDKQGVRLWHLIKDMGKTHYKKTKGNAWKKNRRSDWQKIMHVLFSGGFEEQEE
jgi:hypothetical protein